MIVFGKIVVYAIMACAVIGCIVSIVNEKSELGQEFLNGINAIGPIFLPVAGIMAAAPYLTKFISNIVSPIFSVCGADQAIAATTFIAVDMGGYQLAHALASSNENWIMAMMIGYMAGSTIVFGIPVALKIIPLEDRKFWALGVMSGFLAIPIGVFVSSAMIAITGPLIRPEIATNTAATYRLHLTFLQILSNLSPLIIICGLIACALAFIPGKTIKGFILFGKMLDSALRIIVVLCIIEYFTGFGSLILGHWGFEPIIADKNDVTRALEVAGYIGIMLCGAFPMVYLIKTFLKTPLAKVGRLFHLSESAVIAILAASANGIALFSIVKDLKPEDKVKAIAFSVCGAYLFGDHLSFTANFQPTLILAVMLGKITAGCLSVWIATKLAIPKMRKDTAVNISA